MTGSTPSHSSLSGFRAFFLKELRETVHTWRIWVLPAFVLFAGVSSPIVTSLMPMMADRLGSSTGNLSISVTDPTAVTAYIEYLGNLTELVMFALVIAYGGIISSELRSGTGALALSKPLSRSAFVLSKWLSQLLVVTGAGIVGTLVCIMLTSALFGAGPVGHLLGAVALWWIEATLLLSVMVLLSVLLGSPAAAAGSGLGVYFALVLLGMFRVTGRATPGGLTTAAKAVVQGDPSHWLLPAVTGLAAAAACLAAAVWAFQRREI